MREIKFRGKDVNGKWHIGLLSISQGYKCQPEKGYCISNSCGSPWAYQVRPETVGLISMSKDGHGDIISEGDIIEGMLGKRGVVKFGKHSIKGDSSTPDYFLEGFYCEDEDLTQLMLIGFCEIIGNVFENPELLTSI